MGDQPVVQLVDRRPGLGLAQLQPLVAVQVRGLALDAVQGAEQLQRALGQRALVVGPQLVDLRRACARQPASVTPAFITWL